MIKSQNNSKVVTVFYYIHNYGPVILLLCMATSETGQLKRAYLISFHQMELDIVSCGSIHFFVQSHIIADCHKKVQDTFLIWAYHCGLKSGSKLLSPRLQNVIISSIFAVEA